MASIALAKMLNGTQPKVLKAKTTPTPVSPVETELRVVASTVEVLETLIVRPPAVVVTTLSRMYASTELSKALVAIVPCTVIEAPVPKALPPEEEAVLSAVAVRSKSPKAVRVTLSALTLALSMKAST